MEPTRILETTADIAERYGVTPRTVLKWAAEGTIPVAVKVSSVMRFDPHAVADALDELTRQSLERTIDSKLEGGAR